MGGRGETVTQNRRPEAFDKQKTKPLCPSRKHLWTRWKQVRKRGRVQKGESIVAGTKLDVLKESSDQTTAEKRKKKRNYSSQGQEKVVRNEKISHVMNHKV